MALTSRSLIDPDQNRAGLEDFSRAVTTRVREDVRSRIADIGVVPILRTTSEDDAVFAAAALIESGISVIELSSTFPGFLQVMYRLQDEFPDLAVGVGSLFDAKTGRRCLDAGAKFLSTDGFVPDVVDLGIEEGAVVFPGALTPTEIIAAWKTGAEFVKVIPCDAMGGANYIRSLKTIFPQVRFIASGGVNQQNVLDFIKAGATAVAAGKDLIPVEAIRLRQSHRIQELGRRFLTSIDSARC
jgi:2-dehydro-3-deoxyphosphogluconate aldolase/(4S)-4-hydroxy-2-oxoglutarate aldolase